MVSKASRLTRQSGNALLCWRGKAGRLTYYRNRTENRRQTPNVELGTLNVLKTKGSQLPVEKFLGPGYVCFFEVLNDDGDVWMFLGKPFEVVIVV
jgi:hypothetical protein